VEVQTTRCSASNLGELHYGTENIAYYRSSRSYRGASGPPPHWGGELIKGILNRSAIGTVFGRKTRFLIRFKMQGCTVNAAHEGFTSQMKRLPEGLRRSMVNGRSPDSFMVCKQLN
jgi:hypothetical protein